MTRIVQPRPLNVSKLVIAATLLVAVFVYTYFVRTPPVPPHLELRGTTMGTTYTVKVVGAELDERDGMKLKGEIDAYLAEINRQMSTYLPHSEISTFNRRHDTEPVEVSSEFFDVARFARELSEASGGAFDPTVGPLINLWGFGADGPAVPEPDEAAIAEALASCGYQHLRLLPPNRIGKTRPELEISLAAVAKGYAVDGVMGLLRARGWDDLYVEIGGEVRVCGTTQAGRRWRIGVDYPDASLATGTRLLAILDLADCAAATSGDYRNFRGGESGQRRSHFIDPRTGRSVEHPLASATVIADSCMVADGLATAACVLGPEAALGVFAFHPGTEALLVVREADGTLTKIETPGFAAFRGKESAQPFPVR